MFALRPFLRDCFAVNSQSDAVESHPLAVNANFKFDETRFVEFLRVIAIQENKNFVEREVFAVIERNRKSRSA